MADYTIKRFKGIVSNLDPKDTKKGTFVDGQNFFVDNGILTKRHGCSKLHTDRLRGAVQGIYQIQNRMRPQIQWDNAPMPVDGELIIVAGGYIYTGKI